MKVKSIITILGLLGLPGSATFAQTPNTAFTYQGRLLSNGLPVNGQYDLRLGIFDSAAGGMVREPFQTNAAVAVSNSLFTTTVDFGAHVFTGPDRWLEIGVRPTGSTDEFTVLAPRQRLTATPYSIFSANASYAASAGSSLWANPDSVNTASLQPNAVTSDKIADGTVAAADVNAASFNTTFWQAAGNAGTTPGTHFLGTTDSRSLEFRVNNQRAMHIKYTGGTPNLIAGAPGNQTEPGAMGATIAGGGGPDGETHVIWGNYGVIGGGKRNAIRISHLCTVGGGDDNAIASYSDASTISGGFENRIGTNSAHSTIAGGGENSIASNSRFGTVGGGYMNGIDASSECSAVNGGVYNGIGTNSAYSTIGGGAGNKVSNHGSYATIPGGRNNNATNYAFAAGHRAKANHTGAFVWADSTDADFSSSGTNQFLIRASGGVGIGGAPVDALLDIEGNARLNNNDLFLRHESDRHHGLGWYGADTINKPFAGVNVDGPVLYGLSGGVLGSTQGGQKVVLRWTSDARVGIGTNNPQAALHVAGTVRADTFLGDGSSLSGILKTNSSPTFTGTVTTLGALAGAGLSVGTGHTLTGGNSGIAGGLYNTNKAANSLIGGGQQNAIDYYTGGAAIASGYLNAIRDYSDFSFIGAGTHNVIGSQAPYGFIGGGFSNRIATGADYATIPGGARNEAGADYTLAAGRRAKANHTGTFVWADSTDADFASTANNQFLIRASGGVGIGSAPQDALLDIEGNARLNNYDLFLRHASDRNHGLGWYGSNYIAKGFAAVDVDGPVLYGWGGGILGTTGGGNKAALHWTADSRVGIGAPNPQDTLEVRGSNGAFVRVDGGLNNNTGIRLCETNAVRWSVFMRGWQDEDLEFYDEIAKWMTLVLQSGTGRVGIGRNPTANLFEVAGDASKLAAGDWLANSDARIKTEVATVTNALETLGRVRLVSFRYTDDYQAQHPGIEGRRYLNVVAQEFAEVFPEYVQSSGETLLDGSEILQVDPYPLTIYSAAAVQELAEVVKQQDAEIQRLTQRLARLEQLVGQLTK